MAMLKPLQAEGMGMLLIFDGDCRHTNSVRTFTQLLCHPIVLLQHVHLAFQKAAAE